MSKKNIDIIATFPETGKKFIEENKPDSCGSIRFFGSRW